MAILTSPSNERPMKIAETDRRGAFAGFSWWGHWLAIWWIAGVCASLVWAVDRGAAFRAAMDSIQSREIQAHVQYLADEKREGREAGTPGGYAAGDYLCRRLAALRLPGAGPGGDYLQPFSPNFRNVLAKVGGGDPALAGETIVVSAHYDHVGRGQKGNSLGQIGEIHPGADDNASGVSALLEIAEAFTILAEPPRRTVLFAFWDAEEKGMLGSKHWIAQPTLPLESVRLLVNMDMVGRLRNDRLVVYGARTGYGLRRWVAAHNESAMLIDFSWNALANADHFPFFSNNIPFLTLHTDLHEQYHRPTDTADLILPDGIRRVARLAFSLVYDLANADQTPAFRPAAREESEATRRSLAEQPPHFPERLGVRWSAESAGERGVRLTGVSAQSAAERAGLRVGDRIIEFAGRAIRSSDDFLGAVFTAPASTSAAVLRPDAPAPVRIPIMLDGKPLRVGIVWRVDDAEPGAAILTAVVPGSPAARANLQVDDRIYQINGRGFSSEEELAQLLGTLPSPIHLVVERKGRMYNVELRLEAVPLRRAA